MLKVDLNTNPKEKKKRAIVFVRKFLILAVKSVCLKNLIFLILLKDESNRKRRRNNPLIGMSSLSLFLYRRFDQEENYLTSSNGKEQ